MITEKRQDIIMEILKRKEKLSIHELMEKTNASESTIRRDLTYLESLSKLKRVHGGAVLIKGKLEEESFQEKEIVNKEEKEAIAKFASSLIEEGDCIYIDAGSSTYEMIKFIQTKNLVVVTNALTHIEKLLNLDIQVYVLGGKAKAKTRAIVGVEALKNIEKFRFDKCFLGINAIHPSYGFTTPDSQEAILKETAIKQSLETYVLADSSKFSQVAFVKVADLKEAQIITSGQIFDLRDYELETKVKVV